MKRSPLAARFGGTAKLGVLAVVCGLIGCGGAQEVTPEALERAKELWAAAGIRDYELEWTVSGAQNNHYHVTVKEGKVGKVESVQPGGKRYGLKPAETRFFSVDGLFLTITEELALLKAERPFGQPKGTKVVMRFKPDPKLGYPQWYRRDVMGASLGIAIDVIKFVPDVPGRGPSRRDRVE